MVSVLAGKMHFSHRSTPNYNLFLSPRNLYTVPPIVLFKTGKQKLTKCCGCKPVTDKEPHIIHRVDAFKCGHLDMAKTQRGEFPDLAITWTGINLSSN